MSSINIAAHKSKWLRGNNEMLLLKSLGYFRTHKKKLLTTCGEKLEDHCPIGEIASLPWKKSTKQTH